MDKNQASMETTLDYSQAAGFSATHFEVHFLTILRLLFVSSDCKIYTEIKNNS